MDSPVVLAEDQRVFGLVRRWAPGHRGLDQFYTSVIEGVDRELERGGARLLVAIAGTLEDEFEIYARWAAMGIEGVVLTDVVVDDTRAQRCDELGLRCVVVGADPDGTRSVIEVDNDAAMAEAVRFITGLGHRRIGRVTGPSSFVHTKKRSVAFERELARVGGVGWSVEGDYSARSGIESVDLLRGEHPEITAILFDNDVMAVAATEAARARGLRIPEDLSIIAWDDSPMCQLSDPPLTAVARDLRALGALVARSLLGTTDADADASVALVIVPRDSTAPLSV